MTLRFPLRSAFVAIPLLGESQKIFQETQRKLEFFADVFSFQNPASPHLTLQFWRELMQIEYDQILVQSQRIAKIVSPFTLKVEGVSTFGKKGKETVLFFTIPFNEPLAKLKKRCPWPSIEPFFPHITLARIKHPERFAIHCKAIFKAIHDVSFLMDVHLLRLYAEVNGKKQTPLEDFPLQGN